MPKYKTIHIGTSATESLANALAGLGEKRRTIIGLIPALTPNTSANFADIDDQTLQAYKNQDNICEYSLGSFANPITSAVDFPTGFDLIPLDVQLEPGDGFQVGFKDHNSTTCVTGRITIVYDDK